MNEAKYELEPPRPRSYRTPEHTIDPLFLERWSPRAMSGDELPEAVLLRLFEAARWAPSSYNGQPWRFPYARRGGPHWETFLDLLVDFNQSWAKRAAALIAVVSRTTFDDGSPARTHAFDTGAAWENLALQGARIGLVVHAMQGLDYERARDVLGVPHDHEVHAMVAVGIHGERDALPSQLQEREHPSGRRPVEEIAWEGTFEERETGGGGETA